jgi:hypothetical protein
MSSFDWQAVLTRSLGTRYPLQPQGDVLGIAEWERFVYHFPFPNPEAAWPWLEALHRAKLAAPARVCPRIFVSHKQADVDYAKRIAWLVQGEKIEYWLDAIDLPLALAPWIPAGAGFNSTLLIAALIEMALINCTHVLAVMTPQTAPSRWVPYEYGRIKDDPPGHLTASCWRHKDLPVSDLSEYLLLAPILSNETDIRGWLQREKTLFKKCLWKDAGEWYGDIPEPLLE